MIAACLAAWCIGAYAEALAQTAPPQEGGVLTLEDAILRALNAAPGLRASQEAVHAASAGVRQAGMRPNPELGLEAENIAGSGALNGLDAGEYTLSISQRFERGKRGARKALARSDLNLARHGQDRTRLGLIFTAQTAYIEASSAQAAFENAVAREAVAQNLEAIVRQRVERARDPSATLHQATLETFEATAERDQSRRALDLAKQQLTSLWGTPSADFRLDSTGFSRLTDDNTDTTAEGDKFSPQLALARAGVARAEAAVKLERARAKQDPTISIGVRHFQIDDEVAGLVSFSMPLALFDTNRGNIDRAHAQRRQAEWEAADARRAFERRHLTLRETLAAARADALSVKSKLIPAAEKSLDAARQGYEAGAFSYLGVLDAERVLRDLKAREVTAFKKFHMTRADLNHLLARYREPLPGEETQQ